MSDTPNCIDSVHSPMGPCDSIDLDLFVDGELPLDRESRLFRHLSECASCRGYLNGILSFRSIVHQEQIRVPPMADDALLARVHDVRRSEMRRAKLHTKEPLWKATPTITVRTLLVGLGIALVSAALISDSFTPTSGYVLFEQERVRFDERPPDPLAQTYVFYPGLTIEAERDAF